MENPKKRNFRIVSKRYGKSEGEQDERLSEEPEKEILEDAGKKEETGGGYR
ncbi:MAG: hypothetical protein HFH24_03250 [Ruminococcus sp.]|nr:hypothetical protein [Ruminococcus sp.]